MSGFAHSAFDRFAPAVRGWFSSAFSAPTPIQEQAWDTIQDGANTLVIAPTGSGKTFAAFLSAINRLSMEPERSKGVRILYVSPLKALGADVERNLRRPLAAIAELQQAEGSAAAAQITVGVRSGDTPQPERAKLIRNPPDILITTPESLYLMLTSKARDTLKTVDTVIVDELHSIAGTKRGAHFSLSMERLDSILPMPAQRIGLSATIKPVEAAARFLGGTHPVTVVQDDAPPQFSLEVNVPVDDMTNIQPHRAGGAGTPDTRTGSATIWPYIEASILDQVLSHTSTIVFVNARGICERLTAHLNDAYARRLGLKSLTEALAVSGDAMRSDIGSTTQLVADTPEAIAKAHHGSVSKDLRHQIERELKAGELRCVVATSSLELGIDMGEVDLVIQVAAPYSISSGLQRIGRANHRVGGKSQGIIYPRTRFEVLDTAFIAKGMMEVAIEDTLPIQNALDVLAQQTAAEVAMHPDGLEADAWFATVRKSACYRDLTRTPFDATLRMLAGAFANAEEEDFAPRLDFDEAEGLLMPLARTQKLAVSSAGTIPDRGLYPVMLNTGTAAKGRKRVGELDEEMVHESRVGDVIILGTSTWRITQITNDRVLVAPAPGRSARLPFWHGEGVGRSLDAGRARGALLAQLDAATSKTGDINEALTQDLEALGFGRRGLANMGALIATQRADTGVLPTDARLVMEACPDETGAWFLIIHSPFGRRVHEPWALALSQRIQDKLGFDPQCAATDNGIVMRISAEGVCPVTPEDICFTPEDIRRIATTAVTETSLFAARFRECAGRALMMRPSFPGKRTPLWQQRLRGGELLEAARTKPGFPLYAEAIRECLHDVYDLDGVCWLMAQLQKGTIRITSVTTDAPSPFASPLLFGYVADHLYDGDMPHAERNRTLLSVDPELLGELLGTSDQLALLEPAALAEFQLESRAKGVRKPRTITAAAAEVLAQTNELIRAQLEEAGAEASAIVGALLPTEGTLSLSDRDLRLLRRLSRDVLERSIKPVPAAAYERLALELQRVGGDAGAPLDELAECIALFEGIPFAAPLWEGAILPARVPGYRATFLDELLATEEVLWVAADEKGKRTVALFPTDSPFAPQSFSYADQVVERAVSEPDDTPHAAEDALAEEVFGLLFSEGPATLPALMRLLQASAGDEAVSTAKVTDALKRLIAAGRVTADGFGAIRDAGVVAASAQRAPASRRVSSRRSARSARLSQMRSEVRAGMVAGRSELDALGGAWRALIPPDVSQTEQAIAKVESILDVFGIVCPKTIAATGYKGGMQAIYAVLRSMEAAGEVIRGEFVEGLDASQFARRHTVERLRELPAEGRMVVLPVADPAVLYGPVLPWPTPDGGALPAAKDGCVVVLRDGESVLFATKRLKELFTFGMAEDVLEEAIAALVAHLERANTKERCIVQRANGEDLYGMPLQEALARAGFVRDTHGMRLLL